MTRALKVIVFFTTNNLTIVFFSRTNSQRPRCVYQPKPKSNMRKTDAIHVLLQATCLVLISRPHLVETKRTFQAKETVILVSMDGLGWQFISGQFADTPHLDEVGREGVRARHLFNVVPTKTWPNHHSYMTGLYPESHGIVSNKFWDPVYQEKFIYDYDCSDSDPKFYNASEPIWLTLQKQGGRSGIYFWPGSRGYPEKPIFYEKPFCKVDCSVIDPKDLPKYRNKTYPSWLGYKYIHCVFNYTEPSQSRIDKIINWLKSDEPPQFVALYIDHPDWEGHDYGSYSNEYKRAIEKVDRDVVGYFIDRLRDEELIDTVNLVFVSDHSFNNVSSKRLIILDDYIEQSAYMLTESGALVHIWPKDGKLDEIYDNLTKAKNPHMTVYKKEDIPEEYHWKHNRRIPPIFINPEVGWVIEQSRGNTSVSWVRGTHAWPPQESRSYPIFFARGPAFKKDFEIAPFKTLDLYPLMCQLLGIVPQPNNGSLENVMPLLLQETTDQPTTDPPAPNPPTAGQAEVNMQGLPVLIAISICLPILILQAFQFT